MPAPRKKRKSRLLQLSSFALTFWSQASWLSKMWWPQSCRLRRFAVKVSIAPKRRGEAPSATTSSGGESSVRVAPPSSHSICTTTTSPAEKVSLCSLNAWAKVHGAYFEAAPPAPASLLQGPSTLQNAVGIGSRSLPPTAAAAAAAPWPGLSSVFIRRALSRKAKSLSGSAPEAVHTTSWLLPTAAWCPRAGDSTALEAVGAAKRTCNVTAPTEVTRSPPCAYRRTLSVPFAPGAPPAAGRSPAPTSPPPRYSSTRGASQRRDAPCGHGSQPPTKPGPNSRARSPRPPGARPTP
mmetsp:Transcript_68529/g.178451  ORF Transcript_68529/g.178451 Transcript_68529/m.178451 type:complete len:294 (-) Transcript_68529:1044-1925(-)